MNSTRLVLHLGISFLILSSAASCTKKPEEAIIGKWVNNADHVTSEFYKEGTFTLTKEGGPVISGNYRFIAPDKMRIDAGGFLQVIGPVVFQVSIDGNVMKLTDPKGRVSTSTRQ